MIFGNRKRDGLVELLENRESSSSIDKKGAGSEGSIDSQSHIFDDPVVADHYARKYLEAGYEGAHLFDPNLFWEPKEAREIIRRTDLCATLFAFVMFFALDIDRYNMSNAVSGTLLEDIHITTDDYNLSNIVNTACFLVAEIPSQLISKKLGPNRWIPIQMLTWSIMATTQCLVKNKTQYIALRAILGFLEGGFIPCMCLWLSYFYTSNELKTRIGYFYLANPATSALSALLAFAIFHLHGAHGWSGWRYLFLIEGLFTIVVSTSAFFLMPSSVVQTKSKLRPQGWYTDRQERVVVNMLLRDDPSKGIASNRKGLTLRAALAAIGDYYMWPMYFCRLLIDIVSGPIKTYLPIILKSMGFATLDINLLMIPYNIGAIVTILIQTHTAEWIDQVGTPMSVSPIWLLPCVAAMRYWKGFLHDHWASYALITVALAFPSPSPLSVAWVSANSNSIATRTLSLPLVNCFGQLASVISASIFRMDDAPRYERGLDNLLAIAIAATICVLGTRTLYASVNRHRDRKWDQMSAEERSHYTTTTLDEGNRRLDFRFSL